uniref:Ubiquitin-like domain-containing protein n=1 Tax=Strongyloides papillosus TaxID=174720 RepID=A0A0N5BXN4_STREA
MIKVTCFKDTLTILSESLPKKRQMLYFFQIVQEDICQNRRLRNIYDDDDEILTFNLIHIKMLI